MKKFSLSILIVVILLATPTAALADSGPEFEANLSGSEEVPPVATAMKGSAEFELDDGDLKFKLRVRNNTNDIFAADIHCGAPGANGAVGVTLFSGSFTAPRGLLARGTITAPDSETAAAGPAWMISLQQCIAVTPTSTSTQRRHPEASPRVRSGAT